MNLATRCPACGTVFRVVPDQLKVSEGWVRCGRCGEVFNGAQRLFELEAAAPSATPAQADPAAAPPPTAHRADTQPALGDTSAAREFASLAQPEAPPQRADAATAPDPLAAATAGVPAAAATIDVAVGDTNEAAPATIEAAASTLAASAVQTEPAPALGVEPAAARDDAAAQHDTPQPAKGVGEASDTSDTSDASDASDASDQALPHFMRRAERAARWQQPRRRGLLAGMALLLTALLAAQLVLHYRDDLAARWPATAALLQAACAPLGCRVQAPRHIGALNVDSSGLVRLPGSAHYRLSLVLQNKAPTVVYMPAIELSLTDTQGHTVVRRVLSAAELGHAGDRLAPRSELALQATLDLGEQRVAGYAVELFYP